MTITEALQIVGEELKQTMIETLKSNGSNDTGALGKSITYNVRTEEFSYQLVRTMLKYGVFVDQGIGRKPGERPPVKPIMEWIKNKSIPVPTGMTVTSFAHAIAGKIAKAGTDPRPRPFIAKSITTVLQTTGKKLLAEAGVNEIVASLDNELKDINIKA